MSIKPVSYHSGGDVSPDWYSKWYQQLKEGGLVTTSNIVQAQSMHVQQLEGPKYKPGVKKFKRTTNTYYDNGQVSSIEVEETWTYAKTPAVMKPAQPWKITYSNTANTAIKDPGVE